MSESTTKADMIDTLRHKAKALKFKSESLQVLADELQKVELSADAESGLWLLASYYQVTE